MLGFNAPTSLIQGEFVSIRTESAVEPRRNPGHALTGVLSWATIVLAVLGCFFFPRVWMAIATIFLVYFIVRMCVTTVFALIGQRRIQQWKKLDFTVGEDTVGAFGFAPSDVRHVVIIPTYKEPAEIIHRTLDALAAQHRADERLIVVLGMEEREADARAKSEAMIREYAGRFLHMMATIHPGNIPGEEPGKSSNEAWAGRKARVAIDRLGIDPALATITSCDADSVLDPSYFSAVAASFAVEEAPAPVVLAGAYLLLQQHLAGSRAGAFHHVDAARLPTLRAGNAGVRLAAHLDVHALARAVRALWLVGSVGDSGGLALVPQLPLRDR